MIFLRHVANTLKDSDNSTRVFWVDAGGFRTDRITQIKKAFPSKEWVQRIPCDKFFVNLMKPLLPKYWSHHISGGDRKKTVMSARVFGGCKAIINVVSKLYFKELFDHLATTEAQMLTNLVVSHPTLFATLVTPSDIIGTRCTGAWDYVWDWLA